MQTLILLLSSYYSNLQYEGIIEENTHNVEVMKIKAEDLDLKGTDNWEAVFDIVKGNEAGYFSIKTDPNTNEGILMLNKVTSNTTMFQCLTFNVEEVYVYVGLPVCCGKCSDHAS